MSASFKLLAILVVFLCLSQESFAFKEWISDIKEEVSKRFNRESLEKFLQGGPQLWIVRCDSDTLHSFYRKKLFRQLKNSCSEKHLVL